MRALPAQRVEMIPVEKVTVINPRARNSKQFKQIIDNIAQLGLKKPITVTRRTEAGGPFYDLVCGQGRLEAYIALGEEEVPALVVTADAEDCLVASLVENCARRHHNAFDLLHDIRGMEERGYTPTEIAQKTGLAVDYVYGVARLIERGEHRLLRSVERGQIPLSVAVEISEVDDHDAQAALSSAYERGLLRGRRLLIVRKIIEARRRQQTAGKAPKASRERVSADSLVKTYQEDADRKRSLIRRANGTRDRLIFILEALRRLRRDEAFVAMLEDEGLDSLPHSLVARISPTTAEPT